MPTPEEIFEQLRAITAVVEADLEMLDSGKRKVLRDATRVPDEIVWLTVHAVGATDIIAQAIGMSADQLRDLVELSNRWTSAESELRTLAHRRSRSKAGAAPPSRENRRARFHDRNAARQRRRLRRPSDLRGGGQADQEL